MLTNFFSKWVNKSYFLYIVSITQSFTILSKDNILQSYDCSVVSDNGRDKIYELGIEANNDSFPIPPFVFKMLEEVLIWCFSS